MTTNKMTVEEYNEERSALRAPIKSVIQEKKTISFKNEEFFKITLESGREFVAQIQSMQNSDIVIRSVKNDTKTPFHQLTVKHSSGFGGPGLSIIAKSKNPENEYDCKYLLDPTAKPRYPHLPNMLDYTYPPLISMCLRIQDKLHQIRLAENEMKKAKGELEYLLNPQSAKCIVKGNADQQAREEEKKKEMSKIVISVKQNGR